MMPGMNSKWKCISIAVCALSVFAMYGATFIVFLDLTTVRPAGQMVMNEIRFTSPEAFVGFVAIFFLGAAFSGFVLSFVAAAFFEHLSIEETAHSQRPHIDAPELERAIHAAA
jgi:hypothetical protein